MIASGKDIDLSSLCPQFIQHGLLLNLQVHGDWNSVMQNITYNPVDQTQFVPFALFFFNCHNLHDNYWCLQVFFEGPYFISEKHKHNLRRNTESDSLRRRTIARQ